MKHRGNVKCFYFYGLVFFVVLFSWKCLVREQCLPGDCEDGVCIDGECKSAYDIPASKHRLKCPLDMVVVDNRFCMDRYEATRVNADFSKMGTIDSLGQSRAGALPWEGPDFLTARDACVSVGKRLCTAGEWTLACSGPDSLRTRFCYGDDYIAGLCNCLYAFCDSIYPRCYWDYGFRAVPTGSHPACTSWCGVYDLSGNVWEWVDTSYIDGAIKPPHLRGGAYNCATPGEPYNMLSCDFDGGTYRPASGIRCCHDGISE